MQKKFGELKNSTYLCSSKTQKTTDMKHNNPFTAVVNIDPMRRNYLVITPEKDGRASILHDAMTEEEIGEKVEDFMTCNEICALKIGESAIINDSQIIVRIS